MRDSVRRAQRVRPPALSEREQRREQARVKALRARVRLEQQSLLRGLLLIAMGVLIASLALGGFHRLFVSAWWREW